MDEADLLLLPEDLNPLNLVDFLQPDTLNVLNTRPSTRVGAHHPKRSSVDRLAEVVEEYVQSAEQCQYKEPSRSFELPDPFIDLDIFDLPPQVRDCVLLSQHLNHFLRTSEFTLFTVAADFFEDDDDCTNLIACQYYSFGTTYLILLDGLFINLCTDVQFKHF